MMVACPKGIAVKLGKYTYVNERKCSRQEQYSYLTFYFSFPSLLFFNKGGFLCHVLMFNWCWITSSAFNRQYTFGKHSSFQRFSSF